MKMLRILAAFALVITGVVSTVGSGGGGGGGGGSDTTPPNIISFSPSNNATFIDQAATVSVTFNELINKSSITAESFVLRDQSNRQVSGEMEITTLHRYHQFRLFRLHSNSVCSGYALAGQYSISCAGRYRHEG